MKGIIGKLAAVLGCSTALAAMGGCHHYRDLVDPCYPERYWHESQQNVHEGIAPQVRNGRVLDQTMWNYHFEQGSDRLTKGGQNHLAYLARRRPTPDPMVFLQTAQDIDYSAEKPAEFAEKRSMLDALRKTAIENYWMAVSAGGLAQKPEVMVHNPPEPGMSGIQASTALQQMNTTSRATLPGTGGTSGAGGGGASGGGR